MVNIASIPLMLTKLLKYVVKFLYLSYFLVSKFSTHKSRPTSVTKKVRNKLLTYTVLN